MLFQKNERSVGMLSGGCLEQDLTHHSQEVLRTGITKIVTYDNSEEGDALWGRGKEHGE